MKKITTWSKFRLGIDDKLLLICNSPVQELSNVSFLLEHLEKIIPQDRIYVVANSSWKEYFVENKSISEQRILFTCVDSQELELNFFLENYKFLQWLDSIRPEFVIGSVAHSLYNDEVKYIFEQKISFCLRQGTFIAHTLPQEYLYLLDQEDIVKRLSRLSKIEEYQSISNSIVDDFYKLWVERGQPEIDDREDFIEENTLLSKYLGSEVFYLDEKDEKFGIALSSHVFQTDSYILKIERDNLKVERDNLKVERDNLKVERDNLKVELSRLRDRLLYPLFNLFCKIEEKIREKARN